MSIPERARDRRSVISRSKFRARLFENRYRLSQRRRRSQGISRPGTCLAYPAFAVPEQNSPNRSSFEVVRRALQRCHGFWRRGGEANWKDLPISVEKLSL